MPAIAVTADGAYIYLALQNGSGQPVIVRAGRGDLGAFTAVYNPAAGTAGNVAVVPGNPDLMLFYGNFGSGVQVLSHVPSTGAETNISPAGLTTKVVNGLAVNPSNPDEIFISVNTDQDLLETTDGGINWTTINAALGFNPTGLAALWHSEAEYHALCLAGQVTGALAVRYSPNGGDTLSTVSYLGSASQAVGLEASYASPL